MLCTILLASCNSDIGYNSDEKMIVTSAELQEFSFENISGIGDNGISNLLNKALTKFEGRDVNFRVAIQCEDIKYNDTITFAKSIGAKNITNLTSSSEYTFDGVYTEMEVDARMIEKISALGGVKIYLALPERNLQYETTISDALARKLETMSDKDIVEVVIRTVADGSGEYLFSQNIHYNESFNQELRKFWDGASPIDVAYLEEDKGYTAKKYNEDIEKYVNSILERNNIKDKRIFSDEFTPLGIPGLDKGYFVSTESLAEVTADYKRDTVAAFNADLTKAEILTISTDKDVRAIFLVNLDEIADEYCKPADSLYKN